MVREYHWTLEQADALTMGDFAEMMQIRDGEAKARPKPKGKR